MVVYGLHLPHGGPTRYPMVYDLTVGANAYNVALHRPDIEEDLDEGSFRKSSMRSEKVGDPTAVVLRLLVTF
ncbi:hypothetical protein AC629_32165 [Bradyrhizobium sp. NAS80.1]|nr:hypothetical protein AC629_32165 [Bradyrhizobium sp. NAS80.1]